MSAKKQYTDPAHYEEKLSRVMERLGVDDFSFDYSRKEAWISFKYKGQMYKFEQSIENAKNHGTTLNYGSDAFAQLVLTLEDLARMVERGIYELQTWVVGMKALPEKKSIDPCFIILGFDEKPKDKEEIKQQYRKLAMQFHPDKGGSSEQFNRLRDAYNQAIKFF